MNLDPAVLKVPAFELSFVDGRGVLSLPAHTIGPLLFDVLELDIPDLRFPVDMTGGVRSFRHRRCTVRRANLTIDIDTLASHFHDALPKEGGLVFANLGYSAYDGGVFEIEGEVRLGAQETSFLFRGLIDPLLDGSMRVRLPELRVFAPFPIPAPLVAQTLLHAINDKRTNSHDDTSFARNFTGCCKIDVHPLALALLYTAAPMGWRLPACDDVHLATLHLTGTHLLIDYTTTAPPAPPPRRERYLEQLGAGLELFAEEEGTLAEGSLAETLNTYALRRAEQPEHPFAAERLLSLAVADPAREAEALSLAQEIEEKLPDLPAIPATRAAIAVRQGDLHTAVLEFRKLAKLATVRGHTREEFFALRAATRATLNLTDTSAILTDAITDLERILAIDPEDFEALRTLGRLYAEAGAWTHLVAIRQRQFDLTSSPEARINALIALGEISRVHLNELDVSQEHYQHALALDAGNEPALRGLAEACIEADQPRRALDALDRLCRLANERDDEAREIPLQQRVASLLEHIGNPEEALERLERVLHLDEHCVDARRRVAELLTDLGRATEAVPHLQHLLGERGGPEQRLDVHRHLATIFLHELGDLDAAEEEISGALALDELDLDALTLLRELAERRGDPSALLQSLERIAGISPPGAARSKILLELGTIYASSENRAKDAETTLARAIEHALDEGFAALRALALLYEEGNEPILAIA
ncbi:MAG: hypothetical protein KAI47_23470, partial [Deltaproteobacteria bacterium]|nr:hypothetical protein [Deltaproteobacteria bacterium]